MRLSSSLSFTIANNSITCTTTTNQQPQSNNNNTFPSFSITLNHSLHKPHLFRIHCIKPDPITPLEYPKSDHGGNDGGDFNGGDNGGDGNGEEGDGEGDEEFGPLLNFEAVMKEAEARGVTLPSDMEEAARITGIREMFLLRYLELLQVGFLKVSIFFCFFFKVKFFFIHLFCSFFLGFCMAIGFSDEELFNAEK